MTQEMSGLRWLPHESDVERYVELGLWPNRPLHELVDRWGQGPTSDKIAVSDGKMSFTYAELVDVSRRAASALYDLGLRPNDVLAIQSSNSAILPVLHLATSRIGSAFLTMPLMWREGEVVPAVTTSRAPLLIVTDVDPSSVTGRLAAEAMRSAKSLRRVVSLEKLLSWIDEAPDLDGRDLPLDPHADRVSIILCSSGTTGVPKLSALSSNNLSCQFLCQLAAVSGLGESDTMVGLAPVNTGSTGYFYGVLTPLLLGASSRILRNWSAREAATLLADEACTAVTIVPTQMQLILENFKERPGDSVRFGSLFSSGAAMPEALAVKAMETFGCDLYPIYGSSESTIPTMVSREDSVEKRLRTVGRPARGQELRLVDEFGQPVPDGTVGEITWRGPNNSYGFFNQRELECIAWDSAGFFHSGDVGVIDEDGYLKIVGRLKDMIIRGGHNIYPIEIESALMEHPDVSEVAVVGVPDERFGERTCAVIVPSPASAAPGVDELAEFLGARGMAKYKFPEYVVAVSSLPRAASSKLDKKRIKQLVKDSVTLGA